MFCPSCRAEFREGFSRCESCDRDLIEEKDLPPDPDAVGLSEACPPYEESIDEGGCSRSSACISEGIVVFESTDLFLIRTVADLLSVNDIPFGVSNEESKTGSPSGIFGCGAPPIASSTQFLVGPHHEEKARALLEDFQAIPAEGKPVFSELPPELAEETDEPDPETGDPVDEGESSPESGLVSSCSNCGASLHPTEGDLIEHRTPCRECGKMIEL